MAADNPRGKSLPGDAQDDALIDIPTFGGMLGLRSTTPIYERAKSDPTFPKLIKLSARCTRVRLGDARAWIRAQAGVAA